MKNTIAIALVIIFAIIITYPLYAADVSISVPEQYVSRVLNGMCGAYQYDPNIDGTKLQFTKKQIKRFLRETVLAYEYEQSKAALTPEAIDLEEEE